MEAPLRIVSGKIQCPMIVVWVLYSIQFIYLFVVYALKFILYLIKRYISMLSLILDIEILFNLQISALFLLISEEKNKYNLFVASFIMSIVNSAIILFSIIIIILAFFKKDNVANVISSEPWIKVEGYRYIGAIFIVIKIIEFVQSILLTFYYKRIKNSLSLIESDNLIVGEENVLVNEKPDDQAN